MDAAAPEAARKFYEEAGVTFIRGVDRDNLLWESLDFLVVPNGILVDDQGIVRYAKFGGFDIRKAADKAEVERFLARPISQAPASQPGPAAGQAAAASRLSANWFRLGVKALENGDKEAAAQYWRKALHLDPDNFVIRKQIWALEHPEQFYPKINFDWQREQLAQEKKKEAK